MNLQHCKATITLHNRQMNSFETFIYLLDEPLLVNREIRILDFPHTDLFYTNGSIPHAECFQKSSYVPVYMMRTRQGSN